MPFFFKPRLFCACFSDFRFDSHCCYRVYACGSGNNIKKRFFCSASPTSFSGFARVFRLKSHENWTEHQHRVCNAFYWWKSIKILSLWRSFTEISRDDISNHHDDDDDNWARKRESKKANLKGNTKPWFLREVDMRNIMIMQKASGSEQETKWKWSKFEKQNDKKNEAKRKKREKKCCM